MVKNNSGMANIFDAIDEMDAPALGFYEKTRRWVKENPEEKCVAGINQILNLNMIPKNKRKYIKPDDTSAIFEP